MTRRITFETVSHRHMWFVSGVVTCMWSSKDTNKDKTSFNLEITSNGKSKYGNFGQKNAKILGIFECHIVSQTLSQRY